MKKFTVFIWCLLAVLVGLVQNRAVAVCTVTINATPGLTVCSNETCTLTANPSGGVAPYTFLWSTSQTSQSIVAPTSGTYSVTITDAGLCTANNSLPVLINPSPTPFVDGLLCVCVNSSGVTYTTPSVPGSSYVWVVTGGTFTGQGTNQITVNWGAVAGAGPVKVTETNAAGCVNSSTLNVTITAYPVASVTVGNNNACSGTTVNFQGPAGAGYTYLWNFNDPLSGTLNTSTLQNPGHIFNTYGCGTTTYNVTLTVTNSCLCSTTSLPQAVTIKQQPNPQLTDQDPISPFSNCDNNPSPANPVFQLTLNNTTPNAGCITGYTIDWGDGTMLQYMTDFATATHLYTNLGAFNLVFTATGINGCTNSITYTVANQSVPSVGISNNGGNTAGCYPITFTFTIDGAANNSPGTIYQISYGDGATETKTNEELLVNNIVSHTYTASSCGQGIPGNQYTVKVIATNACLISVEATVNQIKIYKPPVAGFSTSPASNGCVNTGVCVTNTSTPGYGFNCNQITTWLWNFGDPGGANNTSTLQTPPCHTYSTPGTYTITVTASNDQCPAGSVVTHTICIDPSPSSSFTVNKDIDCKPLTVNATNTSVTANTCGDLVYTWSVVFNGAGTCTPSAGVWSFAAGSDLHSQHASFIFNDQGTYTITLAVQNSCTTVVSTKTVTVKTVPKVTVANPASICAQGTVNPTATYESCYASGTTFQWLFPGGSPAGSTSLIPGAVAYNTANTYTLTLNATNECGTGTGSTTLLVKPIAVIPVQTATICSGGSFTITPANAPPVTIVPAGTTYNWPAPAGTGFTGGTTGSSQNSISGTLTNTTNTIQTATYTVTPVSTGCAGASFTVIITINPLPAPYNVTGGGEYCSGGAGVPVGLNGSQLNISYQLYKDGIASGAAVIGAGIAISFGNRTPGGFYTVIATNTTTSCTNNMTGSVPIVINPIPTANAGADISIAYGTSATLAGTATPGTAPLSYLWTPAGSIASGRTTLTPQTTNLYTTTTFTLLVTDSKGCAASDNVIVLLNGGNPLSVACTATPGAICNNGASVQLYAVAAGGSGTYDYSWVSNPVGSPVWTSTLPNPVVNPTVTTIYTVTVNDGFNTVNNEVTVTVYPSPLVFNITGGGEYCSGGAGVFVGLSDSEIGVEYQLFLSGVATGAMVAGTGSPILFGILTAAGIYTVMATNVVTSCTNIMAGTVPVVINPLPAANAGADQIIPFGTSLTLAGIAVGGTAPLGYSWTPAGSIASGGTTLNPQTTNLYTSTTFTFLVTDSKGCTASDSKAVMLNGNPLSVNCNATPATICNNGASVQLNAVAAGGSGTYTYSWVSNPVGSPVWTSNLPNPVVNPTVTTTYTVTVNDGYNSASTQVTVIVNPSPLVYVVTGGGEFCSGGSGIQIGLSGTQMGVSYQLFMNGMPVGPSLVGVGGPIIFGIFTTGGTYTAVATNIATSCSIMMAGNAIIVVNPLPVANAGFDQTISFGTGTSLSGTASGGTIPYSYAWSPVSNIASGANTLTPTTTNMYSSVMFTFSVTDSKGCSSNDNVLVSVGGDPLIASCNATPNMMCNGTTAQLSVNPTGGSGTYTYAWVSNPAGWSSTLQNPTVSPNNSTTYTVTVNDGFTTATCNVQVTVNPLPQVTNSPLSKTICSGTSTSISLFSTVPGTTYQWTSSVISGSVTGNSASGIGTGFIGDILVNTGMVTASVNYLIMPVANGCFGTPVNYVVAVQPLPLIGTSPASQTICSGTSSQPITISSSLEGTTYSWSTISTPGISGAQLNGTSNPVPGWVLNNSAANAGTVAVNIVPAFQGCTGPSLNYLINVNQRPVPSIAGPTNVCVGSSGQLYSTEPGMSGYTWSVSPGGTITSGSGTNQVAITWQSAGSQTVNVSYTNSSGCAAISPSTYPVMVNGVPAAAGAINGLPAVCVNASGVPYSIAPLQNALTYNWTLPLGASMASGSGTNSITVNFPNYVTTGNIRVAGVNNCFTGTSSPNLQVKTNAQLTGQVNLSNMTIGNGQEECLAVQSIILGGEAPFTVQSGGLVRLIAGNNIVFLTGTSINPGGYLSALITQQCIPCNTLKSNDLTRVTAESDGRNETLSTPQDNPYFMIYPNPTDGKFTIASKNRDMDHTVVLQIFDVMGKMKVEERLEPFTKREFSISEFPAGIYHLRLIVDDNTQVIRMIKAK